MNILAFLALTVIFVCFFAVLYIRVIKRRVVKINEVSEVTEAENGDDEKSSSLIDVEQEDPNTFTSK